MRLPTASIIFKAGAISNWLAALPAFVAYDVLVETMNIPEPPRYPFLVFIWAWMGVIWAIAFWEVVRNPVGKRWMIKYFYMEKGSVAVTVIGSYLMGLVPVTLALFSLATDVLWIALFALAHVRAVIPASRAQACSP